MDAIVSGHAGVALLIEGDYVASLHRDCPSSPIPRRLADFRQLFAGAGDLEFLENIDMKIASWHLDMVSTGIDAVHLNLLLLDASLSDEARREAANDLEDLLQRPEIKNFSECVFFAHPLPDSTDLAGAFAGSASLPRVLAFLQQLDLLQESIIETHLAWEAIPQNLFGTDGERRQTRYTFAREGLFRDLVLNRKTLSSIDAYILSSLLKPAIHDSSKHRLILEAWVAPFSRREATFEATLTPGPDPARGKQSVPTTRESLDQLLTRLRPRLKQILSRYQVPVHDQEDLVREALVSTIQKWDEITNPESWLLATLRNRSIVYWRKRRTNLYSAVDQAILQLLSEPAYRPGKEDAQDDLRKLIESLPARCQSLLRLRYGLGAGTETVMPYSSSSVIKMSRRCMSALTSKMLKRSGFAQESWPQQGQT